MNVIISGVYGYIGSALAAKLIASGANVLGFDNLLYEQNKSEMDKAIDPDGTRNFTGIVCDTRSLKLIEQKLRDFKANTFCHFGDLSSVYSCNHNPAWTRSIYEDGTTQVVNFCNDNAIPLIINSTSSLYGTQKESVNLDEEHILQPPTDFYCKSKIFVENLVFETKRKYPSFRFVIFRPATVFGPSPRFRIELLPNHFCYLAVAKSVIKVSELNASRAFISLETLIDVYEKIILSNNFTSKLYNIASYNWTKLEVSLAVQRLTGAKIATVPEIGDLRNLRISSERFRKDFFDIKCKSFDDDLRPVVDYLKTNLERIHTSNFSGLLNMPLFNWNQLL